MPSLIERSSSSGEEDFFNLSMYFSNFVIIFPWTRIVLHLNKLEFPSPKNAVCQVWLKLPSGSGKDGQTDGRRELGDQKTSLELSAQVS